jgi:hypothetical protein
MAVLVALTLMPLPGQAQTPAPAAVRMAPASAQVAAGETVDVAVEVVDVQNLYGFDVTVTFDPQVVEVVDADPNLAGVQVAQGLFLDPGFAVINAADNAAGSAHFVMTQLNPSEPKSGTGSLIVVKLRGKVAGASSTLTLANPQLARRDGFMIPATATAGQITVISAGGPTSTPMPTQGAGTPMAPITPGPSIVPATAVAGSPTAAPTGLPAAAATAVPSRTPVTAASPAAAATATAVPASATPLRVASPTLTSGPSPSHTVAPLASVTPELAATLVAQVPTREDDRSPVSAAPGQASVAPWIAIGAGLLAIGTAAVALWLRRRSASR